VTEPSGEFDARFTADDHFFHRHHLTNERADDEAAELIGLLGLEPGARVLDGGCGDGRIAVRLSAVGFDVTGVDVDQDQIVRAEDSAAARGVKVTWRHIDVRDLGEDSAFDGAYLWFNTWGFLDDAANDAVLASMSASLRHGAPLVIDTLHRDGVVRAIDAEAGPVSVVIEGETQTDSSRFDATSGRLVVNRIVERAGVATERVLKLRLPSLEEWAALLERHHLIVESATSRAGAPLDGDSQVLVLVARRL